MNTNLGSWDATVPEDCDWIIIEKETNGFWVSVVENTLTNERSENIIVTAGNAQPVTVNVRQLAGDISLSASTENIDFTADDKNVQEVIITTNATEWDVTKSDYWIVVDKKDDKITVAVEKSWNLNSRAGVITLTAGETKSATITVTQQANTSTELQELRAFPGAEGYGSMATGGREGRIVAVTNLGDDGEGSLRWALRQHSGQPITVVFNVSGLIELKSQLRLNRANYTIAGQTAPGDGICIMGDKVNLGGSSNFIVRHIRFRIGAIDNPNGSIGIENANNFIVDHCTFGWSGEENMTIYDNKMSTIQWCILHEGLYESGHDKGRRSYGSQWGGETATYHHNLLAHNYNRSPRFNGARANDHNVLIDYVNNVNYNWGSANACYGGDLTNSTHRANFVNNYYKPGPARPGNQSSNFIRASYGSVPNRIAVWYMSGNYMEGSANTSKNTDNYAGLNIGDYPSSVTLAQCISAVPFTVPYPVTTETAQEAFISVLAGAGAFPRDAVDRRIVEETRTGTANHGGVFNNNSPNSGIIDKPEDAGGYPTYNTLPAPTDADGDGIPDYWETANGLNPNDPADGTSKTLSKGTYTNLEVYLHDLSNMLINK